jgi:hypothetical protein
MANDLDIFKEDRILLEMIVEGSIVPINPNPQKPYQHPLQRRMSVQRESPLAFLILADASDYRLFGDTQYTAPEGVENPSSPNYVPNPTGLYDPKSPNYILKAKTPPGTTNV